MSVRLCVECGYDLSGLPAEGTVVTCPECKHLTDLSIPLLPREKPFMPVLKAMLPMSLVMVGLAIALFTGADEVLVIGGFFVLGLIGGAITAGVLTYRMIGRGPGRGEVRRPHRTRVALSVSAAVASVVINSGIVYGVVRLGG